jgi:hypothetical protein
MTTHYDVCVRFAQRGERGLKGHNVYSGYGNTEIYSYGPHFVMAIADDERNLVIVNGDRYSVSTTQHQSNLRGALASYLPSNYRQITIPFSVASAAHIDLHTIEQVDVDQDFEEAYCKTHNQYFLADFMTGKTAWAVMNEHRDQHYDPVVKEERCVTTYVHRLGGSVFRAKGDYRNRHPYKYHYFLSGFDETHNSRNDGYFICELPHAVKTVEEAYESLKPKIVKEAYAAGLNVKRQGDVFAIPVLDLNSRKILKNKTRAHMEPVVRSRWNQETQSYESEIIRMELDMPKVNDSHAANEIGYDSRKRMYARGNLYHRPLFRRPEHKRIQLGKIWHRIVFNTAKGSWSLGGRVD